MWGIPEEPVAVRVGARTYRVYRLDYGGLIRSAELIQAGSDDEARAIAGAMVNGHGLELWDRARHLADYPPRPPERKS